MKMDWPRAWRRRRRGLYAYGDLVRFEHGPWDRRCLYLGRDNASGYYMLLDLDGGELMDDRIIRAIYDEVSHADA